MASGDDYDRGFERCVVTFIDILGYRRLLDTRRAEEIVRIVNALRGFTAGNADDDNPPTRPSGNVVARDHLAAAP